MRCDNRVAWAQGRGIVGERQGRGEKMGSLECNSRGLSRSNKNRNRKGKAEELK